MAGKRSQQVNLRRMMDIYSLASSLDTDSKTLRRFLRLPQWSVLDVDRLAESSVPVIKAEFDRWFGPRESTDLQTIDAIIMPDIEEISDGSLPICTAHEKQHIETAWEIARKQNEFLLRRLSELGLSVSGQRYNPKWRKLNGYDMSRVGTVIDDE